MNNTFLVLNNFKRNQISGFINSFENTIFYAFATNFVPAGNTTPPIIKKVYDIQENEPFRNAIFGKLLKTEDTKLMVRNIPWTANTIYDQWDHTLDLTEKAFFVVVDNTTEFYLFKCLLSPGTPSIDKPLKADTSPVDEFYITNDGYHWKYLYTIDNPAYSKFSTENFVPVIPDANVSGNAISGTIDNIKVVNGGSGYNTFYSNTFSAEGIAVNGNNIVYAIGSDSSSNTGYYIDSVIALTENTGAGQLRKIVDSFTANTQRLIILDSEFEVIPDATTIYEITPGVILYGTGTGAIARALTTDGVISEIEILARGNNYISAFALVTGNTGGTTDFAELQVLLAPKGGHGADPASELYSISLGVSSTFSNSELGTIPVNGEFKQFGILKNPEYSLVSLANLNITSGQFLPEENLLQVKQLILGGTVTINTFSSNVSGNGTLFDQLSEGDLVFVSNGSFGDLRSVLTINSNTNIIVNGSFSFDSSNSQVYYIESIIAQGIISNVNPAAIEVSNSVGKFEVSNVNPIIGASFGATALVGDVNLNGANKGYGTLDLRWRFISDTGASVSFSVGDQLTQGNSQVASATIHSFDQSNGILYVSNVVGSFVLGTNVVSGSNSIVLNSIIEPDIKLFSGDVLFLSNFLAYTRTPTEFETFKTIFSF